MLTARGHPDDVLNGFAAGADDYLTKPFELAILIARIRGLLRRRDGSRQHANRNARAGAARRSPSTARAVHFDRLELHVGDQVFPLTLMEANLLRYLIQHEGKPVSRKSMLEEVWGLHEDTDTRAIDNFIVRLRRYIETTRPSRATCLPCAESATASCAIRGRREADRPFSALALALYWRSGRQRRPSFALSSWATAPAKPRPGIWERVWSEAAASNPAFALSVGDVIPGLDDTAAEAQWRDLAGHARALPQNSALLHAPAITMSGRALRGVCTANTPPGPCTMASITVTAHFTVLDNSRSDALSPSGDEVPGSRSGRARGRAASSSSCTGPPGSWTPLCAIRLRRCISWPNATAYAG